MNMFGLKLEQLSASRESSERNALAIELLDTCLSDETKVLEFKDVAFKTIEARSFQQIGTLVWCLGHFDCSDRRQELQQIVSKGGFEASETARSILEKLKHD